MPIIKRLLNEEMSGVWGDPFAGKYSPAQVRNDCDEAHEAQYHLHGLDFLKTLESGSMDGMLFDPPYSVEQALRCYKPKFKGTAGRAEYWGKCKDEIKRIIKPSGKAVCFGWDSTGIGKTRGFTLQRCVLVCHGACHNDTIITVEVSHAK